MMNEQLTAEDFEVLEHLHINIMSDMVSMQVPKLRGCFEPLLDIGYMDSGTNDDGLYWHITDTGRKALAAYKAQRDLALFIAEFEEWLEVEFKRVIIQRSPDDFLDGCQYECGQILDKYRECKQRIEQPCDE